jgi:hypothetical protein
MSQILINKNNCFERKFFSKKLSKPNTFGLFLPQTQFCANLQLKYDLIGSVKYSNGEIHKFSIFESDEKTL